MQIIKGLRPWIMWVAALAVVGWYWRTDPDGGVETIMRLQWMAWLLVLAGPVYLVRRALMDGARGHLAYKRAMISPVGAGLVFLGLCLLTGLLFLAFASMAQAEDPPAASWRHLPTLHEEAVTHWQDAPSVSSLAGQVEQETCPSLTSNKCWNPRTELKTSREYGFGLGQLTVTKRFDNFAEARKLDVTLRDWQWEDRFDAGRQLRVMILMDKGLYLRLSFVNNSRDRLAMTFAAYNGGLGGVLSDRRLCAAVDGCNPDLWYGHVELHSLKAKTAARGYGKSFFEINREYPRNIERRAVKYGPLFGEV